MGNRRISANTRVCGIIGYPVRHSASPAMQNAAFEAVGLDWVYVAFEVQPGQVADAIRGAKAMKLVGLNVTVPHKVAVLEVLDWIDENARRWGAVNTIRLEGVGLDNQWVPIHQLELKYDGPIRAAGFNTDGIGFIRSLREDLGFEPLNKRVLVVGMGGAGRVVAMQLAAAGVTEIYLVNRTQSKAVEVAREINLRWPAVKVTIGYPKSEVDLLVNATSLGMNSFDPLPVDLREFSMELVGAVYDLVYRPAETALMRKAREFGIAVANGLGMLLYQGAAAFELWTGRQAPVQVMRCALEKEIYGCSTVD